jgi:hypothetical protein
MENYIRIINPVNVFEQHTENSPVIQQLSPDEIVAYSREKRREGINWMEIFLENGEKAYIKKNKQDIFICKYAELNDDEVTGFHYELKENKPHHFLEVFKPVLVNELIHDPEPIPADKARVAVKRIADAEKNKMEYLTLEYNPETVTVTPFTLNKNDRFFITGKDLLYKDAFLETNDFGGRKGLLLKNTGYSEVKDKWMEYLAIAIAIITVAAIIIGFYSAGWLVVGTILIIPGIIVAAVAVIALKIVLSILGGIVHQIRIRL